MNFNKYRIDEITINLDNLRKPLNNKQRKQISHKKLYPYYGANNIMDYIDEYIFDEEIICIAEDGGSWGFGEKCSYIVNEKCWVNNHAHVLKAKDHNLNLKYLNYYLNYHDLNSKITGTTRGKLTKSALSSIEIMLPNREKQDAIVNTLDKAQELIDKRKEQIDQLDELVKSRFIEMFGDLNCNPKGWKISNFKEFAKIDTIMTKDFEKYQNYPHIGIESIEKNTGNILEYKLVKDSNIKSGKYVFDERHIIYSKIRPNLNKVALPNFKGLCSADSYPILCIDGITNKNYLGYVLRSEFFLNYILNFSGRTNIPKVNKEQLKGFNMPVPPIELQNQFSDFVTQVDKIKIEIENSLKELEDNFNSLMQKAFKGELF